MRRISRPGSIYECPSINEEYQNPLEHQPAPFHELFIGDVSWWQSHLQYRWHAASSWFYFTYIFCCSAHNVCSLDFCTSAYLIEFKKTWGQILNFFQKSMNLIILSRRNHKHIHLLCVRFAQNREGIFNLPFMRLFTSSLVRTPLNAIFEIIRAVLFNPAKYWAFRMVL